MWSSCAVDGVLTISCVPVLINQIIYVALAFAGTTSVFFIIRAGYQYIMSNGDPKQAGAARLTLTYAIIGLILVFSSFFLLSLISNITGTKCIQSIGFSNCK